MTANLYFDFHILQSVPPSNLNRDDAGTPKNAIYGGSRRSRVSSQAWKRAARTMFAELAPPENLGTRTKKIRQLLANRLVARTTLTEDSALRLSEALLAGLGISTGKKATDTAYLLFFGYAQLDRIVDLVAEQADALITLDDKALKAAVDKLPIKSLLETGHPIDVALFGRMVADIAQLNVDAAVQVAHAISTHAVEVEFDYFTAVDDENPKEDTGAGMIGTIEFNSATLYRYATVGVPQLLENLGGDVDAALTALRVFLSSFARSMPTGYQNSFAHRTSPSLVTVAVRTDQPVNLVSAFEKPVRGKDGIVEESINRFAVELAQASSLWGLAPVHCASTYSGGSESTQAILGTAVPFDDLITQVVEVARTQLGASS